AFLALPLLISQCDTPTPMEEEVEEGGDLLNVLVPNDEAYANSSNLAYWVLALNPENQEVLAFGKTVPGDTLTLERPDGFTGNQVDVVQAFQVSFSNPLFGESVLSTVVTTRDVSTGVLTLASSEEDPTFDRPSVTLGPIPYGEADTFAYALRSDQTEDDFDEEGTYSTFSELVSFQSAEDVSTTGFHVVSRRATGDAPSWDYQLLNDVREDDGSVVALTNDGWLAGANVEFSHPYTTGQAWGVTMLGEAEGTRYPIARYRDEDEYTSLALPTLSDEFSKYWVDFEAVLEDTEFSTTQYSYFAEAGGNSVSIPSPTVPDVGSYSQNDAYLYNTAPITASATGSDFYILNEVLIDENFNLLTYNTFGDPAKEIAFLNIAWPADVTATIPSLGSASGYVIVGEVLSFVDADAFQGYADFETGFKSGASSFEQQESSTLIFNKGEDLE
ncbi:MAG: hypothetical protein AAFQ98_21810, partial [Bacteroidota bacterium]